MDATLRTLIRRMRESGCPEDRERARVGLARSGVTTESIPDIALSALWWAFVDQLDFASVAPTTRRETRRHRSEKPESYVEFDARERCGEVTVVRVWLPTVDDILDAGGAFDVRAIVRAPLRGRTEIIDTVQEALPGGVVTSWQVTEGEKPGRVLTPVHCEAEWPQESMRVHVRS